MLPLALILSLSNANLPQHETMASVWILTALSTSLAGHGWPSEFKLGSNKTRKVDDELVAFFDINLYFW
jgi:hypothetical protein